VSHVSGKHKIISSTPNGEVYHSKRGQNKKKILSLSVFILKGGNHDKINVVLAVLPMELVSRSGIPMKVLIALLHLEATPFLGTYTENS
jgi:hypothetical protein